MQYLLFFPFKMAKCIVLNGKKKKRKKKQTERNFTYQWILVDLQISQVKSLIIRISSNSICRNQRKGWCDSSFENIRQCHLIPLIMSFLFKYFLQPVHLDDILFCSTFFCLFHKICAIFTTLSIVIKIDNTLSGLLRLGHGVNTYHCF